MPIMQVEADTKQFVPLSKIRHVKWMHFQNIMPSSGKWGAIWKQHLLASDWLGISVEMVDTLISGHSSTARVAM